MGTSPEGLTQMFADWEGGDQEAARLCNEVLALRGRVLPDGHPMVAGALHVLGRSLLEQGKPAGALPLLRDSLTLRRKTLPSNHWLLANSESVLGECLGRMGEYVQAEPLLVASHRKLQEILGPSHPRTRESLDRVIRFYGLSGKPEKAAVYRQQLDPAGANHPPE